MVSGRSIPDQDVEEISPRQRTLKNPIQSGTNPRISDPSLLALQSTSFAKYLLSLGPENAPKAEKQFALAQLPKAISQLVKIHKASKTRYEGNGMRQFPMYSMAELDKSMKALEYNGSVIRAPRNVASTVLKHAPAITSFMSQLLKPMISSISSRPGNTQYNRNILHTALPQILRHSNLGSSSSLASISHNINNDRYEDLLEKVHHNRKALNFGTLIPQNQEFPALGLYLNQTVSSFDKLLTNRLSDMFKVSHGYVSTAVNKLRHLLAANHNTTHSDLGTTISMIQGLTDEMEKVLRQGREAEAILETIRTKAKDLSDQDWWVLIGPPASALIIIIFLYIGLVSLRSSLLKSLKARDRKTKTRTMTLANQVPAVQQPLLGTSANSSYNVVLEPMPSYPSSPRAVALPRSSGSLVPRL